MIFSFDREEKRKRLTSADRFFFCRDDNEIETAVGTKSEESAGNWGGDFPSPITGNNNRFIGFKHWTTLSI